MYRLVHDEFRGDNCLRHIASDVVLMDLNNRRRYKATKAIEGSTWETSN